MDKKKIEELEQRIQELEKALSKIEKQSIVVVGTFDGTNIPITIQGIRRKISTSTP